MPGGNTSFHSELQDKACKRKWTPIEDATLVSCMVDLYNIWTYRADTGFRSSYLLELERMLAKVLVDANLKAKFHIESRIRTLKKDWSILYNLSKSDSGFGWDYERNMPVATDEVWKEYTKVHKEAAGFRYRSFPHYHDLSMIYGKDRATGKDRQLLEELLVDISAQRNQTEFGDGTNSSVNIHTMVENMEILEDISHNDPAMGKGTDETTSRRKTRKVEFNESSCVDACAKVAKLIGNDIKEASEKLSKSIDANSFLTQCQKLYGVLSKIEGLTSNERRVALKVMPKQAHQMIILFSLPSDQRLAYVKDIIEDQLA